MLLHHVAQIDADNAGPLPQHRTSCSARPCAIAIGCRRRWASPISAPSGRIPTTAEPRIPKGRYGAAIRTRAATSARLCRLSGRSKGFDADRHRPQAVPDRGRAPHGQGRTCRRGASASIRWSIGRLPDLIAYIDETRLPKHPLVNDGYPSIGCIPCTRRVAAGEGYRDGRWAGLEKDECGIHPASTAKASESSPFTIGAGFVTCPCRCGRGGTVDALA